MDRNRKLSFGVYKATEKFKSIPQHSCVCFEDDLGLVAVTGPADDKESQEYAQLFAGSLELLEALELAEKTLTLLWEEWKRENLQRHDWDAKPEHLPNNDISFPLIKARAAIKKVRGS